MTRLFTLCIILGVASPSVADTFFNAAPSFSGPHPAVVRIVAPERDGTSYGSGALVAVNESSGLVLTNWHVVRDAAAQIVVYFPDGFRSGAYLLRTDRDWDLAALAIRRPNVLPIPIANQAPRPGDELTIAGYGSGSYRAVTGRLTKYYSPGGDLPPQIIELSAPARNGDSGGPILNSRGELAGTLFGSSFGCTMGSYCGRLQWFLNAADGDFERISSQALLAQQSRRTAPTAAINPSSPLPLGEGQGVRGDNSPLPQAGEGPGVRADGIASSHNTIATANASASSPWPRDNAASKPARYTSHESPTTSASAIPAQIAQQQTPSTPLAAIAAPPATAAPRADQIKSILALVGALALLYFALRFLGWAVG